MQVRNIRPSIDVYTIGATGQEVARGDVVTVDDDLGVRLCEQTVNWAPDGDESISFFVEFCRWVEAVQDAHPDEDAASKAAAKRAAAPFVPLEELPNPALAILAAEAVTEAAAADKFTARTRPVTDDLVEQLRAITDPTERARAGQQLFGKRYTTEVAPLLDTTTNGQEG